MQTKKLLLFVLNIFILGYGCKKGTDADPASRILSLSSLTTSPVSNITPATATCGGNITDDGGSNITARGLCWGTTNTPAISGSHTSDGTGTGAFSGILTGLSPLSTYYVRAYATNNSGTAYGNAISFTTTAAPVTTNVYVGGYETNGAHYVAKYWKNGVAVNLTDGSYNAQVSSLFIAGTDVYAAGLEVNAAGKNVAKYWKNGVAVNLTDGTASAGISSIVVSGNDVYAAGYATNVGGTQSFARYWKNGTAVTLTDGTHQAEIRSIVVVGTDVYAGGYEVNGSGYYAAKYWKNGIPVILSSVNKTASVLAMLVSGTDVYTAGYENAFSGVTVPINGVARYWKNTALTVVGSTTTQNSTGSALAVAGNDIYVTGFEKPGAFTSAVYWKNGVAVNLTDGTRASTSGAIAVVGSDVYVGGYEQNASNVSVAKYWKNGTAVNLSDGTKTATVTSMVVIP